MKLVFLTVLFTIFKAVSSVNLRLMSMFQTHKLCDIILIHEFWGPSRAQLLECHLGYILVLIKMAYANMMGTMWHSPCRVKQKYMPIFIPSPSAISGKSIRSIRSIYYIWYINWCNALLWIFFTRFGPAFWICFQRFEDKGWKQPVH